MAYKYRHSPASRSKLSIMMVGGILNTIYTSALWFVLKVNAETQTDSTSFPSNSISIFILELTCGIHDVIDWSKTVANVEGLTRNESPQGHNEQRAIPEI